MRENLRKCVPFGGKVRIFLSFSVLLALLFFGGCDLPENSDTIDESIPAVWAALSPDEPVRVYITKVVPYSDEPNPQDSLFVHGATLTLSWDGGSIDFVEHIYYSYYGSDEAYYATTDTTFRVAYGVRYTLSGETALGHFQGSCTVPPKPDLTSIPDTIYFDNVRKYAFEFSTNAHEDTREIYCEIVTFWDWEYPFISLPDSLNDGDCADLRWYTSSMPETVKVQWCNIYSTGKHEFTIYARSEQLSRYYDFLDRYDDDEDFYPIPKGDGYIGVIGAFSAVKDTFFVTISASR